MPVGSLIMRHGGGRSYGRPHPLQSLRYSSGVYWRTKYQLMKIYENRVSVVLHGVPCARILKNLYITYLWIAPSLLLFGLKLILCITFRVSGKEIVTQKHGKVGWSIWLARNDSVFNDNTLSPNIVAAKACANFDLLDISESPPRQRPISSELIDFTFLWA